MWHNSLDQRENFGVVFKDENSSKDFQKSLIAKQIPSSLPDAFELDPQFKFLTDIIAAKIFTTENLKHEVDSKPRETSLYSNGY